MIPQVFTLSGKEKKALFQSNISFDSNFGIKISLCQFNLEVHTMKCLSVLSSFILKKFKENTIIYIIQSLCIYSIFTWLIIFTLLLFNIYYLYFFNLLLSILCLFKHCVLFFINQLLSFITVYTFLFFSPKATKIYSTL